MVNITGAGALRCPSSRGFTFFELILLIALLGVIAVVALPRFIDMPDVSEEGERDAVVGAVRAGIAMYNAQWAAKGPAQDASSTSPWPVLLDDEEDGPCVSCFSHVLRRGLNDTRWVRGNAGLAYAFTPAGGKPSSYVYDPAKGVFDVQKVSSSTKEMPAAEESTEKPSAEEMMEPVSLPGSQNEEDTPLPEEDAVDE